MSQLISKLSCGLEHVCLLFENSTAECYGGSYEWQEAGLPVTLKNEIYDI